MAEKIVKLSWESRYLVERGAFFVGYNGIALQRYERVRRNCRDGFYSEVAKYNQKGEKVPYIFYKGRITKGTVDKIRKFEKRLWGWSSTKVFKTTIKGVCAIRPLYRWTSSVPLVAYFTSMIRSRTHFKDSGLVDWDYRFPFFTKNPRHLVNILRNYKELEGVRNYWEGIEYLDNQLRRRVEEGNIIIRAREWQHPEVRSYLGRFAKEYFLKNLLPIPVGVKKKFTQISPVFQVSEPYQISLLRFVTT